MNTERNLPPDVDRVVRSWLHEDRHEDATRVLDNALAQVDTAPQRRSGGTAWRTLSVNNKLVPIGLGVAAVVAVLLVGSQLLGSPTPGGPGSGLTPSPQPSVAEPSASVAGDLPVGGTYFISLAAYPIAISVTIPAPGWDGDPSGGVLAQNGAEPPDGAGLITFVVDDGYFVYGDPCQWSTTRPDTLATTVDELVAALAAQASRDASAPVDITLDGYAGKSITLHVPDDANFAECDDGKFASWGIPGDGPSRYHQGPGQIDKLWILDVDGHLVVIDANYHPGTPQDVVDELDAIVESATFELP